MGLLFRAVYGYAEMGTDSLTVHGLSPRKSDAYLEAQGILYPLDLQPQLQLGYNNASQGDYN